MKLKLDANQQEAVAKELSLDAAFAEVDVTNMTEVSGGTAIGPILTFPLNEHGGLTSVIIGWER